MPKIMGIGKL